MSDHDFLKQALDALECAKEAIEEWGSYASDYFKQKHNFDGDVDDCSAAIEALRAALAQPEPEPVFAFRRKGLNDFCTCTQDRYNELAQKPDLFEVKKFYTAPPQREWRGLTTAERKTLWIAANNPREFGELIEAKLKEKNCEREKS